MARVALLAGLWCGPAGCDGTTVSAPAEPGDSFVEDEDGQGADDMAPDAGQAPPADGGQSSPPTPDASEADEAEAVHPFDLPRFRPALAQCRLQCPSTSGAIVSNGEFDGFTLPGHFYLVDGTTMVLSMDDVTGGRCELRHNAHWSVAGAETKRLYANMRITPVSEEMEAVTIAQIHVRDFEGNRSGPLMRLVWEKQRDGLDDHLWVNLRQDLSPETKSNRNHDLGPRPVGFFDLQVRVVNSELEVAIDGSVKLAQDVSYFDAITSCYFKTGAYLHGSGEQATEYNALEIETPGYP